MASGTTTSQERNHHEIRQDLSLLSVKELASALR
jgi:uncharacterized small protein (DUF1192 family)